MMYPAYIALVVIFVLVIVLQAWFVRRLSSLRDQAHAAQSEYHKLQTKMRELAEAVSELKRGKESNQTSLLALEREIEEIRAKIHDFLEDHEALRETFAEAAEAWK